MEIINGLFYSKDHEWVKVDGNRAYIGITDYAQHSLGSVVFVELPEIGVSLSAGDALGVVESVKAASDIYSPISGKVVEANDSLADTPEKVNDNPYESWVAVVEMTDASELDGLMDAAAYEKHCQEEA